MITQAITVVIAIMSADIALARDVSGRASVVDGDTIDIQGERIRFNGIDAPESRQTCLDEKSIPYRCGKAAAEALDVFLSESRPTTCRIVSRDRYKRFVGTCFRADGVDVSAWLTRHGHALDWPKYSKGAYAVDQLEAKNGRAGIWIGAFQPPWEWRKR